MDKEIIAYKEFCQKNGLKEGRASSLDAFRKSQEIIKLELPRAIAQELYGQIKKDEEYFECDDPLLDILKVLESYGISWD